ncbi:MAG: HTTM domain-containing protein [Myxococcaceae bacterium]|nr:HTTM domain-containing protein [Myxococcaceae bacterium]
MKRVLRWWQGWVELVSRREDAASLAMARIVCGATVAVHLILLRPTGAVEQSWVHVNEGGAYGTSPALVFGWLGWGTTAHHVDVMMAAAAVAGTLMALGLFTRVTTVATWLLWRSLTSTNGMSGGSSDDLLINALFILMWSGCGRTLSVDAWLSRRRDPNAATDAPAWPRYVMIFQLCTLYWTTGIQKISNSWWPPPVGTADAIWYILQQVTWNRAPFDPYAWAPFYRVTQLMTAGTWLFEVGGLVLLLAYWYRHTRERPGRVRRFFNAPLGKRLPNVDFRLLYLAFGFSMHFGIWVLMEVGPFFLAVLVFYCAVLTPAEWRAALGARPSLPAARPETA